MNRDDSSGGHCPYLSEGDRECLMTNGGLYIPMPEHVNNLCQTSRFDQCHHYIQGCSVVKDLAGHLDFIHNDSRRRYRRINERMPLQLSDCGQDGRSAGILDHEAFTVDLSFGGIRLESRVALPVREKICFMVGQRGDASCWEGQGEVRWTDELATGIFQSGLLVTDNKTFQAIGQHLSLSGLSQL